jgi:hypothetical protein
MDQQIVTAAWQDGTAPGDDCSRWEHRDDPHAGQHDPRWTRARCGPSPAFGRFLASRQEPGLNGRVSARSTENQLTGGRMFPGCGRAPASSRPRRTAGAAQKSTSPRWAGAHPGRTGRDRALLPRVSAHREWFGPFCGQALREAPS